jgi:DNA-binding response OmpR family regulator
MHTVLVVEDNRNMRTALKLRLEHRAYSVQLAADGLDALRLAQSVPPDLILLDLMLPRMDGLVVLDHLKSDPRTSSVPIIVLTASGDEAHRRRSQELGVTGYFSKPLSLRSLVSRIDTVFEQPRKRCREMVTVQS